MRLICSWIYWSLLFYTFGNVSAVDRKRSFAIKPSGVPYEILKPEDIVILDYDANVVEGNLGHLLILKPMLISYKN